MATQELPSFMTTSIFTTTVDGTVSTGTATVVITSMLPTQALPPYLSASTFVSTIGGVASTGVSTVEVPITYFGPSIPLGPDDVWTFGGSTSPTSTSQLSTTTAIPSTSSSSSSSSSSASAPINTSTVGSTTATSSSMSSSSTSSSGGSLSSMSSTLTSGSGSSTSTPSSSSTPQPHAESTLHRALPGIIIAAVVVALVFLMLCCLCYYRRRRRAAGAYEHPNLSDFVIVDAEGGTRVAGEGVPRPTGEEEDSFLARSGEATDGMRDADPSARLVTVPSRSGTVRTTGTTAPPEGVVPTALATSKDKDILPLHGTPRAPSPFFHSSVSSLFFNPSRGPDQAVAGTSGRGGRERDSGSTQRSSTSTPSPIGIGNIIPTRQLLQMDDEWNQEAGEASIAPIASRLGTTELGERVEDDYIGSPLRPPPVLNPDGAPRVATPRPSMGSVGSQPESPGSDIDERVMLLTARRFRMDEAGPSTLLNQENGSGPVSWGSSLGLGLGGLTRLSRLSWFQRMEALRSHSPNSDQARSGPSRSSTPASRPRPFNERGLSVPRPLSHLSAGSLSGISSSGDTVFYDALSSVSTRSGHGHGQRPVSMPPLPPPRAVVVPSSPASAPHTPPGHDSGSGSDRPVIPSPVRSWDTTPANTTGIPRDGQGEPVDILDTPVPAAVSPFSTASSRGGPAIPPGLEHLANVRSWRESSSDMPSAASFGTGSGHGMNIDLVQSGPDILEEAPPRPREGWAHLRAVTTSTVDSGRRTTLGQPILINLAEDEHDPQHTSEQGSLHSMPERLSPFSPVGSGSNSRAPSRHTQYGSSSYSSGSSRGHSPRDGSGSGSQLGHSNSITSDGRRRPRREPGEPMPSPPGSAAFGRARLSALGGPTSPFVTPQRSPDADQTSFSPAITGIASMSTMSDVSGGSHTTRTTLVEPPTGELTHMPAVQWPANGEDFRY